MTTDVFSIVGGDNSDLIAEVARLYVKPGDTIADVTYGQGVFWRKVDLNVTGSDLLTVPERPYNFTDLHEYEDNQFDIAVLDPPYIHSPGKHTTDSRYRNAETTKGMLWRDLRQELFIPGMMECARIAKRQIWVKCMDQVQSGMQRWGHIELFRDALSLGLFGRDLFILVPTSQTPKGRWKTQHHARKGHSYLWIFEHPTPSTMKQIRRENLDTI